MNKYVINDYLIFKGNFSPESKYRTDLSQLLLGSFGNGPYTDQAKVREVLTFSYNYYCKKFTNICQNEKSVRFYQFILSQHESCVPVSLFIKKEHFPEGITPEYLAVYRRTLKLVLEEAVNIPLHNKEESGPYFFSRALKILNELVFIGDMIFSIANMYSEQDMIEDVAEITFEENLYVLKHKHHYDYIINYFQESNGVNSIKHVVDQNALPDLKKAFKDCFTIDYEYIRHLIADIHRQNEEKGGIYCGFEWEALPLNIESMFGGDINQARIIFKGLTLNELNKLKINELASRPQTMNRYMYRPILIWKIDGNPFAIIGPNSFMETIIQIATNTIPWGKAPEEWWVNSCFKNYIHSKEDDHDKWLDDAVETRVVNKNLQYHRTVKSIVTKHGQVSIITKGIGEIDFIIINHETEMIYIADCKHLQGRYDMISQRNDFANFTKNKGYNQQINNKVKWAENNRESLNYHNRHKYGQEVQSIQNYTIEGIFIINNPTFYMYNSDYRIYTVDIFVDIITKELVDEIIVAEFTKDGLPIKLEIKYPYFKKPNYELQNTLISGN